MALKRLETTVLAFFLTFNNLNPSFGAFSNYSGTIDTKHMGNRLLIICVENNSNLQPKAILEQI